MRLDEADELRALVPFTVGGAELMLVPNQPDGAEPSVLLIARHREGVISEQLALARVYRLAAHLMLAAADAELLAGGASTVRWATTPHQSKAAAERPRKSVRKATDATRFKG